MAFYFLKIFPIRPILFLLNPILWPIGCFYPAQLLDFYLHKLIPKVLVNPWQNRPCFSLAECKTDKDCMFLVIKGKFPLFLSSSYIFQKPTRFCKFLT